MQYNQKTIQEFDYMFINNKDIILIHIQSLEANMQTTN